MKNLKKILFVAVGFILAVPLLGALPAVAAGTALFGAYSIVGGVDSAVYALITPSDLSFHGEELKDIREAVFEATFDEPQPGDFHTIQTGIKALKQIGFVGRIGMVGKSGRGCDPETDTNNIPMSEKFWNPKSVSFRLAACKTDLLNTLFVWSLKNGVQAADVTSTDFFNMVVDLLPQEQLETLYRIAWFGDTAANNLNGSPAGVLTNGVDPDYFNAVDGFFKQMAAAITATPKRLTAGLGTRNAGVSYAAQAFDNTDRDNMLVTGVLQKMRYAADIRLRNAPGIIYVATQSVWDEYENELIWANKTYTTERLENGMNILKSGNITVYAFNLWDRIIDESFNTGAAWYRPHRVVLINPEDIQIGLEDAGSFSGLEVFFDKVSKKNFIDGDFTMDAKLLRDYMFQAAW